MKNPKYRIISLSTIFIGSMWLLSACSTLRTPEMAKPNVSVSDVSITGINFNGVDFELEMEVENPNDVPLKLKRYSYAVSVEEKDMISGDNSAGLEIAAKGKQTISVPLSLNYQNTFNSLSSIVRGQADSLNYLMDADFIFDVPVLGSTTMNVSRSGALPVVKIPEVSFDGFEIKQMSMSGASFEVTLDVYNPNSFLLEAENLAYEVFVNGRTWANGGVQKATDIAEKARKSLTIPVEIKFSEMGMAIYQLISSGKAFDYRVQGSFDFDTSLPEFNQSNMPFDLDGRMSLGN